MKIHARFIEPWVVKEYADGFAIHDARGVWICGLSTRHDLHKAGWTLAEKYLSQEEGRELAEAISKIESYVELGQGVFRSAADQTIGRLQAGNTLRLPRLHPGATQSRAKELGASHRLTVDGGGAG